MTRLFTCLLSLGFSISTLAPIVSAANDNDEAIKQDRQRIAGTWQIVGLELNGDKAKDEDVKKLTVVNRSDGTWSILSEGKEISKGTSQLDPTQEPKTIDFTPTEGGGKGSHYRGIYQLNENDKTRQMCFAPPGKDRPSEFVSTRGSEIILVKFARKSDDEAVE